ncbi:MAG: hypothetical protein ABSA02_24520 [Trebonia sp.]
MLAVTAALVGSVAAGVGVPALPAGAAVSAGQAGLAASAASEPSVTIKAIDREGKAVAVTASLESAASSAVQDTLTSGHAAKVPAGTYNVAAWVWEPNKKATTLVDRAVTITSSVTVTFDARRGKPVRFTVNDSTVAVDGVAAEPFSPAAGQQAQWNHSYGPPIIGPAVYLVPGPLPNGWDLLLQANLVRHETGNRASPVEYNLVKILSGSIPAKPTFASTRAGLAQDHVTIRDFGQGIDSALFDPQEYGDGAGYGLLPSLEFGQQNVLTPASVDVFFSPGYRWESVSSAANNDVYGTPLLAGHTYSQTFNAAVFSPSPLLGPAVFGNSLTLTEAFGNDLLVDAANQGAGSESVGLYPTDPQGWLYEGSKLIAHASGYGANFGARIPATTQTYTLKFESTRVNWNNDPIGGFSKSVTATYTFKTEAGDTSLSDFWPRMIPRGVSEKNTTAGGSRTTVPITFDSPDGVIAAHDVAVWSSVNGGKSWSALRVTHSGSTWSVVVGNPEKAGWVSLKVQGEDAAGFKATVAVLDAYAVS